MTTTAHSKGQETEDACCAYLKKQGLSLIEKNFHCRNGEIDLIMKDDKTIVFIEVRYRRNNNFGGAIESITPSKQKKVRASAETYIQCNAISDDVRIDFVAMTQDPDQLSGYTFEWIKNAF